MDKKSKDLKEAHDDEAVKTVTGEAAKIPENEDTGELFDLREYTERMGDRFPEVGEIVLFYPKEDDRVARANNNDGPIPAIVTRVWSNLCVNLKIVPDSGPMQDRTSVVRRDANPNSYFFDYRD